MINPNILMNFMMWYVSERENNLSKEMRKALNLVHWLNEKRKVDLTLAITIVSEKKNVDKQSLYLNYKKRQSFISASKKLFKTSHEIANFPEQHLCECGCGEIILNTKNKFINGHNVRLRDKQYNIELSKKMREAKFNKSKII
jgi:hypothetical protein